MLVGQCEVVEGLGDFVGVEQSCAVLEGLYFYFVMVETVGWFQVSWDLA